MDAHKKEFIELAIRCKVLRFGEFVLKSGRKSPYFFNSGLFDSGSKLARLAQHYARAIEASGIRYDMLYGPAYKGIPLVAAVSVALSEDFSRDVPYCFNRKETKVHGEGGSVIGAGLKGDVLIVDDVISAGTSVRESVGIISEGGARAVGLVVSLDRQERGPDARSAIQAIEEDLGLRVLSIVNLDDLVAFLQSDRARSADLERVRAYRQEFGATGSG
ncbi:MAG TPA: orotate phosphoribosyltransferase [Gammaproteobacteria bacterium]|nr:orotate phosphoribosyltransferase [Gammaproteobacteria bacterium]